jgi:hypothetical protein
MSNVTWLLLVNPDEKDENKHIGSKICSSKEYYWKQMGKTNINNIKRPKC